MCAPTPAQLGVLIEADDTGLTLRTHDWETSSIQAPDSTVGSGTGPRTPHTWPEPYLPSANSSSRAELAAFIFSSSVCPAVWAAAGGRRVEEFS
ncbi:hypothetical protein ACFWPP_16945 [Streptomyces anulatus]|uniref:hypothetical protein n=1 Tax=Streptomyces anulatus TaxID=1892 RepID=UPI00364EACE0